MKEKMEELVNIMNAYLKENHLGLKISGNPKFYLRDNWSGKVEEIAIEDFQEMANR